MPFVRWHRSVFPRTPRNTGVYTHHPTFVTATSGVLTRLPAKLSKNRMRVYTLSDRRSEKKLRVYTASEAKGLMIVTSLEICITRVLHVYHFIFFKFQNKFLSSKNRNSKLELIQNNHNIFLLFSCKQHNVSG